MTGILALWNDRHPERADAYEAWYAEEHLPERLGLPGFLRGRRYQAVEGAPAFFTYYETETPDVLTSPVYLERVENPTPRTREIMTGTFTNMSRTVCRVAQSYGVLRGAWAAVASFDTVPADPSELLRELAADPQTARAEMWLATDDAAGSDTTESRLRGGDTRIGACLFVETLREAPARTALARLSRPSASAGLYQLLCEMTAP